MNTARHLRHWIATLALGLTLTLASCNGNSGTNVPSTGATSVPAATDSTGVGGDTTPGATTGVMTDTTGTENITSTTTMTNTTSP